MEAGQACADAAALRDPQTGRYVGVDRFRSFTEVVVSDVDFTDPLVPVPDSVDSIADVITAYGLGGTWRPMSPPILRLYKPLHESWQRRRSWLETHEVLRFNDETGAMDTSSDELADLYAMLDRAMRA